MHNFFVEEAALQGDCYRISGSDYNHIKNVLRMKKGEEFFVSISGSGDLCRLEEYDGDSVLARIIEKNCISTELPISLYLFQGLPKSDKMELIIQKCTELGVEEIIPVEMSRCVVKLDEKKKKSKIQRWQSISESAAKQSKRNLIPRISDIMTFDAALKKAEGLDLFLVPYESAQGMESTKKALSKIKKGMRIGILIGPEGGFEEKEIEKALEFSGEVISLGKRILRTETAAVTAAGMCMLYSEMNLGGDEI